jgi:pimeloyl-ACP methyl ester carboxylesterase
MTKRHAGPDALALLLHTSGTTSRPKLVPLTHANICLSARNNVDTLQLGPDDRSLGIMPFFHVHGLIRTVVSAISAGGTVICTPGFQAPYFLSWLGTYRPSWYTATPAIHQAILSQAAQQGELPVRSTLRVIRTGSAAIHANLLADLERVFGVPVVAGYGMTETSGQITSNPLPPRLRKSGSVGLAAGPDVAVFDERGVELGSGQVGEIVVRGPSVMNGYLGDEEANRAAFAGEWLRTGDQGYRDEDGYFFLTGRLKEIINRGGEKISPYEVEHALLEHPAVAQAIVFAVPDRQLGETVGAAVVLRPGAAEPGQKALREFAAGRLAFFKVPQRIVFVNELPKGPTGKPQRVGLAERLGLVQHGPHQVSLEQGRPVDERAPQAAAPAASRPGTPVEVALAHLWTAALGLAEVGVHDDFFEAGGNSIAAVQLLFSVHQRFGVNLRADTLLRAPTIARMARCIERNLGREPVNVSPLDGRDRPMTGTERRLAAMWEEVLEVRPVGVRDDFFDLGGRASHVERLFSRIQSAFGEGLPIRALNEAPTVEELARLIDGTDRAQSTLIAPLQTDGSGPPLFAIHAGAGYVFFYRSLAHRLRPAIPVYAVQAQGHLGDRQRPYATTPSIEALAARYVCEIRAIRPSGPYHLAGASFGGVVAFEMARQLRAAGERVSSLFLFSPHIRNNPHAKRRAAGAGGPDRERFEECPWPRRLVRHLARCSRLEAEEAAQYVAEKTRGSFNTSGSWHGTPIAPSAGRWPRLAAKSTGSGATSAAGRSRPR